MVGSGRADTAQPLPLRRTDKLQYLRGIVKAQYRRPLPADQTAQGRSYGGGYGLPLGSRQGIALPAAEYGLFLTCRRIFLGLAYQVNVPVIGIPGAVPPSEQAVIDQHHAAAVGRCLDRQAHQFGKLKAGTQILHHRHAIAIDPAENGVGFPVVGQPYHRIGVGMGHALKGQKGVEQGFNGGTGRIGVEDAAVKVIYHFLVGHPLPGKDRQYLFQFQAGKLPPLHRLQVGAGTLNPHYLHLPAQEILFGNLDRGIAAAPDHQVRIGANQAAHIDQRVQFIQPLGGAVGPEIFHRQTSCLCGLGFPGAFSSFPSRTVCRMTHC